MRNGTSSAARWAATFLVVLVVLHLGPGGLAWSQGSDPEAPSQYLETIETQGTIGGEEGEVDAGAAQAEAQEAGENDLLSPSAGRRIEEIVVRARKREEFLEDTPLAVTALGQSALRESNVIRLDGIQELVPNLNFVSNSTGATNIQIRGVGTGNRSIAFDPGVGVYVDGVFIPRALGLLMDVVDVQQIEVLRGPQGTLFGKNTVGGAVNVTTVKPSEDLGGFVMVQPGNFGSVTTRFTLNVPVRTGWFADKLFTRVSAASTNTQGYVYDSFRDEYFSNRNSLGFFAALRLLPTDDVTIDLAGSWSRDHNRGLGGQCIFVQAVGGGGLAPPDYPDECRRSEPFRIDADTAQINDVESYGAWLTGQWDLGAVRGLDDLSLESLTSWRQQVPRYRFDVDSTRYLIAQFSAAGGSVLDGEPGFQRQISQELQATGEALDGDLSFVTGAFLFFENGDDTTTTFALPDTLNRATTAETTIDNYTWALFGQATYDVMEWMSLTAGLRYTEDKKGLTFLQSDPRMPDAPPFAEQSGDKVFPSWTPMASLALTAPEDWLRDTHVEHLMGYFTYSRGFKGGGFNAVANQRGGAGEGDAFAFDPETLDNFELGFKMLLASRTSLNIALFYGSYDDIQVTSIRDLGLDEEGAPQIERLTLNAAEATNKGVEVEVLSRPLPGLQINANLGYLDARYDSFPNGFSDLDGSLIDRSGQRFQRVPELQTFIGVQYSIPVALETEWLAGWLTPRIEWAYQSSINYLGPEIERALQPGVNLINARLSYGFLDDRAQVALWGRNLSDEAYFNNATPAVTTFGSFVRYFAAPRTYGGELSYTF